MKDHHGAGYPAPHHAAVNEDPEKAALLLPSSYSLGRQETNHRKQVILKKLPKALVHLAFLALCLRLLFGSVPFALPKAGKEGHRIVPHRGGGAQKHHDAFPDPADPFHFIPCTETTVPPALDDSNPPESYAKLYDPDPKHWSWGEKPASAPKASKHGHYERHEFAGRGIYLCGYLDVPLDYTNSSDKRIARLAVTKYHVSGIEFGESSKDSSARASKKSEKTIVVEPGGPGGSGTSMAWRSGEKFSHKYSNGTMDVLGWDPRGVNASLPSISCYPYNADRDRWSLLTGQYRETAFSSPRSHLALADAMNEALMQACWERHGDLPRFVSTAFVSRDLEEIRKALNEETLTGVLISYGTGIGQTYANMFPESAGRMILDGTEYVRDHRLQGGFGWTALDNVTDAFRDGFLGECAKAGPEYCALARPHGVTLKDLSTRMQSLFDSILERPQAGYLASSGPALITYSNLIGALYSTLYRPQTWATFAQTLADLENGNTTTALQMLEKLEFEYDPASPPPSRSKKPLTLSSDELGALVICADSYDAPEQPLEWWDDLWRNMTQKSFISGNSRFSNVFPCRHFNKYWIPAEVYRGDLNHTLNTPIMLVAEPYDPATPLRNGRRLLAEMGQNARMLVHHGYGHSSLQNPSECTDSIQRNYIMTGEVPTKQETDCYADLPPYMLGLEEPKNASEVWTEHSTEMRIMGH